MSSGKVQASGSNNPDKYIVKGRNVDFTPEPKGLGYALFHSMNKFKHAVAQIDGITGVKDIYGDLLNRCIRTAIEMRVRGIKRNDIVTICSWNHLNSVVPIIASTFVGAIMATLDPGLSLDEITYLVKQVSPKMAFVDPENVELVEKAFAEARIETEIVVFGSTTTHSEFSDFFAPKANKSFNPIEADNNKHTILILFSSGTTGLPKGICISHYLILGQALNIMSVGFTLDVSLSYATFYWISAVVYHTACILTGNCRLIVPRYNPATFWKLLEHFKVSLVFMSPTMAIATSREGRPEGKDTTHLRDIVIGGGPIAGEYIKKVMDIFPGSHVVVVYGLTEIAGIGLCYQPNVRNQMLMVQQKPSSTGMAMPGFRCKIVDPETEETLGPQQRGELRLKSEFVLNGYYNLDSSDAWDSEGWLKTGDIVYYDEDNCFYVVDRLKEMLKFRSYHVSPAVIEAVLLSHPSIAAAAVVGIPDDEDGEHPLAAVVLRNPRDKITATEVVKFVEERVHDRQKLRGGVKFLEKLPLTATGKVRRRDIREKVLRGEI